MHQMMLKALAENPGDTDKDSIKKLTKESEEHIKYNEILLEKIRSEK